MASLAPLLQGNSCHLWTTPAIKIVFLYWIIITLMHTKIIELKSSKLFVHKRFQGNVCDEQVILSWCNNLLWQSFKSWIKRGSNQCRTHLDFTTAMRICKEFPLMSWGYRAWIILLYESYSKGIKQCFGKNLGQHIPETTYISFGSSNFFWRVWNERNKKIPIHLQKTQCWEMKLESEGVEIKAENSLWSKNRIQGDLDQLEKWSVKEKLTFDVQQGQCWAIHVLPKSKTHEYLLRHGWRSHHYESHIE